jgi:hypothetical protein
MGKDRGNDARQKAKTKSLEQAATQNFGRPMLVGAVSKRSSGMVQTHSSDDAEYAAITPDGGVPMLDWPSGLFSDEVSMTQLVAVDFLLQCDPEFVPHSYQSPELYAQLAA